MSVSLVDIQNAYNLLVAGIDERAHMDEEAGNRAYGGAVRSAKGLLVESIAANLVRIAWQELDGNPERLTFRKETVKVPMRLEYLERVRPVEVARYIRANIEKYVYGHRTDVHVNIDGRFVLGIECKAYTEKAVEKFKLLLAEYVVSSPNE